MKRSIMLVMALMVCLVLAACGKDLEAEPLPSKTPMESETFENSATAHLESADTAIHTEEPIQELTELVGLWHLDEEKNDLAAFADSLELFPGYGEWGAGMEIRSSGVVSWYIGAEGWHGTCTVAGETLHAQLTSDLEQSERLWDFRITTDNEKVTLEMPYNDMTIYWVYGNREDQANGNEE